MRLLPSSLAVLLVLPLAARASPGFVLLPALGRPNAVTVQGRVLKQAPSVSTGALSKNLGRLTESEWEGASVTLSYAGIVATTVSGDDGFFELTFTAPKGRPFAVGEAPFTAKVTGMQASALVEIVSDDAPFLVVTDFDDTIAVTNVNSAPDLLKSALLQDGATQPAVAGMSPFYGCLRAATPTPGFALVSGSPQQYAPRLETFLATNQFPFAGVYLRDLGPGTMSDYKQPIIRRLMFQFPQPMVLIGDSGEHDPEVYAQIRREFPGRVRRIYIHDVGKDSDPTRFDGMLLFHDPRQAALDAGAEGLLMTSCVAKAFGATSLNR